ncbi:hypothetical protein UT300012_22900 [Paraclostridium bifermentans]
MNFREKQELLSNIEAEVDYVNSSVNGFRALAVDTQFFTDGEIVPTIYVLVVDGSNLSSNKIIELELSDKFDNVTFDIVGHDYYLKNISGSAQIFYQAK